VYEFMNKFRHNPANPGLHLKQLKDFHARGRAPVGG
jgi:hypothetical protein